MPAPPGTGPSRGRPIADSGYPPGAALTDFELIADPAVQPSRDGNDNRRHVGAVKIRRYVDVISAANQPEYYQQRPALVIDNGRVYISFGGLAGECAVRCREHPSGSGRT